MDHIKLLCDIGELNHLFRESISVENFMQRTVDLVAHNMRADVCSIYIYEEERQLLILEATKGLDQSSIGKVNLKLGEGLTGKALKELRPICVSDASSHPNYKYFEGIGEEKYENFLAVPIMRGVLRIGVLVLQRKERTSFTEQDVLACRAVASQLANIIENARFLMTLHIPEQTETSPVKIPEDLKFIRARTASQGFAFGKSRTMDKDKTFNILSKRNFTQQYNIEDFEKALNLTKEQLESLQEQIEEKLSDSASLIFASHLMILTDHEFVGKMRKLISSGFNPPDAVIKIAGDYISIFSRSENAYVREKVQDVEDLTVRLVSNLIQEYSEFGGYEGQIIIAPDLFPSDLLRLSSEKAAGVILVSGGVTSHLSILARSLKIPMIITNRPELNRVPQGTDVLLDGETGNVYVQPAQEVVQSLTERYQKNTRARAQKLFLKPQTLTADNTSVKLLANINLISDLKLACELNCDGVGLYRTEFPFMIRSDFPSEQEQFITYSKLTEAMGKKEITFRTLDIGGDKVLSYYKNAREQNPSLGLRSIRFSLHNKEIFAAQIRAILRAGADSDLRIMFPMISSLDELDQALEVLHQSMHYLHSHSIGHNQKPKIGIMIEIPSVISLMPEFCKRVDFFSIGTNDFIQFMLGVDRTNENVESFYIPHHPSVLRSLNEIASTALKFKKDISICGDMASQHQYIPFLLGIGIRSLSLDPSAMPRIQQFISHIQIKKAQRAAKKILTLSSIEQISGFIEDNNPMFLPDAHRLEF